MVSCTHRACNRGPLDIERVKYVKLGLAASMSANNATVDPRSMAVVSLVYHLVDFETDDSLLVRLPP